MNDMLGMNGFVWWQGVVEDRKDPLALGRLRVRILGWHTEDKNKIPTEELPWAYPIQPITSAAMSGVGSTPLGPVEGTWVLGFFRDGQDAPASSAEKQDGECATGSQDDRQENHRVSRLDQ